MPTLFNRIGSLLRVATGEPRKQGPAMREVAELRDAYLVVEGGKIRALGPMSEAPSPKEFKEVIDCSGRIVLPGFVDSHTHVLYAGDRSEEFEMRLQGKGYREIAKLGGGIRRSMQQVREATIPQLIEETLPRVQSMLSHGTTTAEIKSGYGLSFEAEIKMLEAIGLLRTKTPVAIHATFLGAHDVPPEVSRETYLREVTERMIPEVSRRGLAEFCDIFCDEGYFTPEETRTISRAARGHGLKLKIHANELAASGGVVMAVEMEALSADHLLVLGEPQ